MVKLMWSLHSPSSAINSAFTLNLLLFGLLTPSSSISIVFAVLFEADILQSLCSCCNFLTSQEDNMADKEPLFGIVIVRVEFEKFLRS